MSTSARSIDKAARSLFQWLAVGGASVIAASFIFGLIYKGLTSAAFRKLLLDHFPATVGLPGALLASVCVVILIESRSGPIELEGFGMKFKGASGGIVLCTFLFLAIAASIKLLW